MPISNVPLGASVPSRVPCPPASSTALTLPFLIASFPSAKNSSRRASISFARKPEIGSIFPFPLKFSGCARFSSTDQSVPRTCASNDFFSLSFNSPQ